MSNPFYHERWMFEEWYIDALFKYWSEYVARKDSKYGSSFGLWINDNVGWCLTNND